MSPRRIRPYADAAECLSDELRWLDRALALELQVFSNAEAQPRGQGWFVSREDVEQVLYRKSSESGGPDTEAMRASLREVRRMIVERRADSASRGLRLPLPLLAHATGLSAFDEIVLLVCLAAELEAGYGKLYAYLHDDLTRKLPSLELALRLARSAMASIPRENSLLSPASPLRRWQLVTLVEESGSAVHRLNQGLQLDERIAAFLLDVPGGDRSILPLLRDNPLGPFPSDAYLPPRVRRQLVQLLGKSPSRPGARLIYFHGAAAADGERIVHDLCVEQDLPLLRADLVDLLHGAGGSEISFAEGLRRVFRESLLRQSAVYFTGFDRVRDDEWASSRLRTLDLLLRETGGVTFTHGQYAWVYPAESCEVEFFPISLPLPEYAQRLEAWRHSLGTTALDPGTLALAATRYRLTISQVQDAVRLAHRRAEWRGEGSDELTQDDLISACRATSQASIGGLARRLQPRARWDDLVLPTEVRRQLREICAHVRHRPLVYQEWGFDQKLSLGKGLYILLSGPSGTGKTLAAEVLARELGLDLLKVDLSSVISKYIGESEKNLQRIFDGAERSDAILFFDEADGIFGKRSEVRDAHDRYANIEVNFLLQRLEEYEGVVILATNFSQNLDEAFCRRMHFSLDLPFPNENSRLELWRRHLPPAAPVGADVDFSVLAQRFQITGGNIRNIMLNAAFLAAEEGAPIGMTHLFAGTRREYEKIGKLYSDEDFTPQPYYRPQATA